MMQMPGDSGDGYPNGTLYYCDFYGKFTQPEKINDYTYEMQLENIATKGNRRRHGN